MTPSILRSLGLLGLSFNAALTASAFTTISENFAADLGAFYNTSYDGTATPGASGLTLTTPVGTDFGNASIRVGTDDLYWGTTGATYSIEFGADPFTTSDVTKSSNLHLFLAGNSGAFAYEQVATNGIWAVLIQQADGSHDLAVTTKIGGPVGEWYQGTFQNYLSNVGNPGGKNLTLGLQEVGANTVFTVNFTGQAQQSFIITSIAGSFSSDTQAIVGMFNGSVGPLTASGVIAGADFSAIPEPSTYVTLAASAALVFVALRRRRSAPSGV
ncbi:hypothetical protein IMCC26134_03505 [Verrucomicrobia bacterium IMCC26134]|nr:hypothetical protein IMCC26134_03505 [Verrucomicrobia bacterium IMCC26134]